MKRDFVLWLGPFTWPQVDRRNGERRGIDSRSVMWSNGSSTNRSTEMMTDELRNAGIRLRAIIHNRSAEETAEAQRQWDERVAMAEIAFEKALINAGMMSAEDAVDSIASHHEARKVGVILDSGKTMEIQL